MSEKLQISKDSIDLILSSNTFNEYTKEKQCLELDEAYQMYKYILNNQDKFSVNVINHAKLKYVKKESILNEYRGELDNAFNQVLKLYSKY